MSKKYTYYFSHDFNARSDEKIISMRMKHGAAGYGVYWMLIEKLAEVDSHRLRCDYSALSFDIRADEGLIRSVVEDFDLFVIIKEDEQFYSQSLNARLEKLEDVRRKRSEAGKKANAVRWQSENQKIPNLSQTDENLSQTDKIGENKGIRCNAEIVKNGEKIPNASQTDTNVIPNGLQTDTFLSQNKVKENNKDILSIDKSISNISNNNNTTLFSEIEEEKGEKIDYDALMKYWNTQTNEKFGKLRSIGEARRRNIRARVKEYGKEALVEAINKVANSEYLHRADVGWFNFDWMILPTNFEKVISGNYDNRANNVSSDNTRDNIDKFDGKTTADF